MNFPRKWSVKSSRISLLVVQTGFPASLLDLFLNSHHRFNATKTRSNIDNKKMMMMIDKTETMLPTSSPDPLAISAPVEIEHREERLNSSCVAATVLKVFLVVALAFGTKRLAFGITVSAFLLLVLECLGRFRYAWLSRVQFVFESMLHRFLMVPQKSVFNSGPMVPRNTLETEHQSQDCPITYTNFESVCPSFGGVELVEPKVDGNRVGDCDRVSGGMDDSELNERNVMDEKMISTEEGFTGGGLEVSGIKNRRSRGAKLKSKIIHKLVPKKLRCSKKDKNCKGSEAQFEEQCISVKEGDRVINLSCRGENVGVKSELVTESEGQESSRFQLGPDGEKQGDLGWPSHHSRNHVIGKETIRSILESGHSYELLNISDIQNKLVTSNIQMDVRGKSGYVMLVVIVLAGLVGGRILSFLLAIGYFCILKCIRTLRRKDSSLSSVQR